MTKQEPGICPACGRFVGPADVCPYCDTDGIAPSPISLIRWAALFTSVAGVAFLWLMARNTEPNMIRVCDVSPKTRLARVMMAGIVERQPSVRAGPDIRRQISFQIHDGSGSISILARGDIAKRLMERYGTPERGEFVTVHGTLDMDRKGRWLLRPSAWLRAPAVAEVSGAPRVEGGGTGASGLSSCDHLAVGAESCVELPR